MQLERRTFGGVTTLVFTGELDAFDVPSIDEEVEALIREGRTRVVCNLKGLGFINSPALACLIRTARRLTELRGELVISAPSESFLATLETLGLDQFFRILPGDDEAVRHLRSGGADVELLAVFFRLLDDPEAMAVGGLLRLHEDGPTFQYPVGPDDVSIDPGELGVGRRLWIQFPLPIDEGLRLFEMEAEIVLAAEVEKGARKYRVRYTEIDDADRRFLEQHVRGDDGAASGPAHLRPRRPFGSGEASPGEE